MDRKIEKFQLNGSIYVWTYLDDQSHYPGWNITGDNAGCDSLVGLLEMMEKSDYPSRKSIRTIPATTNQVKVANGGRYKTVQLLTLHYKRDGQTNWIISDSKDGLIIQFNRSKMQEFKNSIQMIKKGKGDFAISDDLGDNIFYFWWNS